MSTWAYLLLALMALGALGVGVLYLVRASAKNSVALAETDAALDLERERVAQMEASAAKDREARRVGFDVKASAVHSATDAAELLRAASGRKSPPN